MGGLLHLCLTVVRTWDHFLNAIIWDRTGARVLPEKFFVSF